MAALIADLLLLLGLSLRVTHLITSDTISERYLREPLMRKVRTEKQEFWIDALYCPWCVGFWICGLMLLSLLVAGGPGDAASWWRVVAGWFTLNYIVARAESLLN